MLFLTFQAGVQAEVLEFVGVYDVSIVTTLIMQHVAHPPPPISYVSVATQPFLCQGESDFV